MTFINITKENISSENLCCAISDKKHQDGVAAKKKWLGEQIKDGHIFRKMDAKGKVFIEYAPLENAWVPVTGENYLYIYCLWVSGSFSGHGYGKELLEYCIEDAERRGKAGVCAISSVKKKPFLSDRKFLEKYGFQTADMIGEEYILSAMSFDGTIPHFTENAKTGMVQSQDLTIYYGMQCPYISDCVKQVENYCAGNQIPLQLIRVDTLEKAKAVPGVFNNWAVFYRGRFETVHLLNEGYLKKNLK